MNSDGTTTGATSPTLAGSTPAAPGKKKLSYLEAREYATIEQRVEEAEQFVQAKRAELEDPANAMDAPRLVSAQAALDAAQLALDALYARWAQLEKKNG
jgi:ATP-binding cassette subfamily F protein uup